MQFWTPDFLRGYGVGTPNGSLWTICVMVQAYLVMWFLYRLLHGKKAFFWVVFNLFVVAIAFTPIIVKMIFPEIIFKLYNQTFIPYLWIFTIGMTISEFFDKLILFFSKFWLVFALSAIIVVIGKFDIFASYGIIKCFLMGPAIIGFSYAIPNIKFKNDYSYGIYISYDRN